MRKLIVSALGLGLLAVASISVANAQTREFYPGSPGSPYTTGSLKRHKPAVTHHARKARVHRRKVKKAQER